MCSAAGDRLNVEEYLDQHPELLTPTDANEQQTLWDRSLFANRDITYPVENQPIPEVRVDFSGKQKHGKRLKSREKRQVNSHDPRNTEYCKRT